MYYVVDHKNHNLVEKSTGYVVMNGKIPNDVVKHLNSGGGFKGMTPFFFVDRKLQKPEKVKFRDDFLTALENVESRNSTTE